MSTMEIQGFSLGIDQGLIYTSIAYNFVRSEVGEALPNHLLVLIYMNIIKRCQFDTCQVVINRAIPIIFLWIGHIHSGKTLAIKR